METELVRPSPGFYMSLSISTGKNEPDIHYNYEGDVPKEIMDAYQSVVGNGLARVSVGTDLGIKDFGTGAGAMVNVSLACNQDQQTMQQALNLASSMGIWFAKYHRDQADKELTAIIEQKRVQAGRT